MIELLHALTAGTLGVSAGAQIEEEVLFVPYSKSIGLAAFNEEK